jgi:hypothetical protein
MRVLPGTSTMIPCSSKLLAVAVAVCVMSSCLSTVDAHAALQVPVSRNVAFQRGLVFYSRQRAGRSVAKHAKKLQDRSKPQGLLPTSWPAR